MIEPPIAAVIWDMDGLLLDTERVSNESWLAASAELGLRVEASTFHEIIGTNNAGTEAIVRRLFGEDLDYPDFHKRVERIYQQKLKSGAPLKLGAKEAITLLAERGFPQAVATSSRRSVAERKLGHHGMIALLNGLVGGDEVAQGKPHPEPFEKAARLLGVLPAQCIVFEDSINGILAAHRAGTRPILVEDLVAHPPESLERVWRQFDSLTEAMVLLDEISR